MNKKMVFILMLVIFWEYFRLSGNVLDHVGMAGYSGLSQFEGIDLPHSWHEFEGALETFGSQSIYYEEDYLREGERILFRFRLEQEWERPDILITDWLLLKLGGYVNIYASIPLTDRADLSIPMYYDYASKTIIYEPVKIIEKGGQDEIIYEGEKEIMAFLEENQLTQEDIRECQEYVLYDVILKSWVGGYGIKYELEKWELKRCRVKDLSFS